MENAGDAQKIEEYWLIFSLVFFKYNLKDLSTVDWLVDWLWLQFFVPLFAE